MQTNFLFRPLMWAALWIKNKEELRSELRA